MESAVREEWVPRGNLEGITNVVTGENILGGLGEIALNTAGDAIGGLGAGALVSSSTKGAVKEGGRLALKEALKKQASVAAAKAFVPVVAVSNMKKDSRSKKFRKIRGRKPTKNCQQQQQKQQQQQQQQQEKQQQHKEKQQQQNDQQDDEEEDSEEYSTDEASTEESSTEEESSEDQCQAIRSDGRQCHRDATQNGGACNLQSHQRQIRANNTSPFQLDLNLQKLDDFIKLNADKIVKNIQKMVRGTYSQNVGIIYIYTLPNGNIKIGRTAQPDPKTRWNQQRQYPSKSSPKTWTCRIHTLAETLILNILDFARLDRLEEFDAELLDRGTIEEIIRVVIKAINKALKKRDEEEDGEESSDLPSTHYPDQ